MAIHATARIDWIQARLMGWLRTQTLTGSPAIAEADEPALAHLAGPWARVTFDELPPTPIGRWDATHSAMRMALVMSVELFWPASTAEASPVSFREHLQAAAELRDQMTFLRLSVEDYTTPGAPSTVADAMLAIQTAEIRRIPDTDGYRRRQVRGVVDWVARFTDPFA